MRRLLRLLSSRRTLVVLAVGALLAPPVGWIGARTFIPIHVEKKLGRSNVSGVTCLYCHRRFDPPPTRGDLDGPRYVSPAGIAVAPDGSRLWVTASGADRLLEVNLTRGEVVRWIEVGAAPGGVAVSGDGTRIAVAARDADEVVVLDAESLEVLETVPATEPMGVALSENGARLYVANGFGDDVSINDLGVNSPPVRVVAGNRPYALAASDDGALLAVANLLARPVPPLTLPASELTIIDARTRRVRERRSLISAHLSEGVALSSDGSFALATIIRARNLLPITQVARGAVMTSAVAFVETKPGGRTLQLPLDEVNAYFADTSGIALTPDDRLAFVAHGGADVVTVVDVEALRHLVESEETETPGAWADDLGVSSQYVVARIPTRHNPRAVAVSPDGSRVYVAERLADSVAVIDTGKLQVVDRIDLGGPRGLTAERRGEQAFHDASVTFQGQFSCRSCHPDGHTDGLVWDFDIDGIGRNLLETRSLRGIRDTAPFKWNGKNPNLQTQCGPRFARVLTRSDPFPPARLEDLVAFIESIPVPPKRVPEDLAEALERGREIYFRTHTNTGDEIPLANRCGTCHRGPLLTDRLLADVGTGGRFDTPHLFDVTSTEPYLHDGRALTLEEIWTVYSPDDTHGVTNDLSKAELNDLVIYLRSL